MRFRKYDFIVWRDSIVGQAEIVSALHESITQDTLSHAMIIEGSSGYGGLPLVLSLAQHILCSQDGATSCGQCKSCQQVEGLIHPDLHIGYPVVRKEGKERKNITSKDYMTEWRSMILENPYTTYNEWIRSIAKKTANGDINVKECNDIIQQLNMQAFSGAYKVQIIWIADRLGSNGNKLLKLIEEPPEGTFIFLICDNIDTILKTITSRCRVINMPRVDEASMSAALITQDVEEDQAKQISFISDGDFAQALTYAQLEQNNLMELCLQWMKLCADFDLQGLRQWSTEFGKYNSEEQKVILNYFLKILQSVIYHQMIGPDAVKLSASDKAMLLRNQSLLSLTVDEIDLISQKVSRMITMIQRYVTSRMVMFDASLSIGTLLKKRA